MNIVPVKKALFFVVVTVFLIVFCGSNPSGAFNNEPIELSGLHLAQKTQDSANESIEPLGLHIGLHLAEENQTSANTPPKAPEDVIIDRANEPVELPSLGFSLLMAQQTQTSDAKQSEKPGAKVPDAAKESGEDEDDDDDEYDDDDDEYADDDVKLISDPLIQANTDMYNLNDTLYFWVLKPLARGYGFIIPKELRSAVVNVFYNIRFPVRFLNSLFQGKGQKASYEFGRFFINTTVGFLGIANVAANYPHLQPSKEDLGQTFAVWGIGNGAYIMLPFLGPSSVRDGLGRVGDTFLDPIWWLFDDFWTSIAIRAGEAVNETSLRIGEYEALKEAALDPYVMIRNAYVQNRNKLITE
ncbi:MAG: VacJ family lipoprotein [Desulfobacterales bacterium]